MSASSPPAADASVADARGTIRFLLNGNVVCIERPPPTLTVLDYLRDVAGACGTKEGCAEGDCGACTVVVGELTADRSIAYRAVNSCIRFLPTLDGKELVTVESLEQPDGGLHPVQRSMVDQHASQCGFCTPGFVMSLLAAYLHRDGARRDEIVDALAGNLCRCTGYRPIIEAGLRLWDYPAPIRWSRRESQSAAHVESLAGLAREPASAGGHSLRYPGYHAPRSLEELGRAFEAAPESLLLAGGTDVGLWVTKQLRDLPALIYVGDVSELARIDLGGAHRDGDLWIGAAVTLTDAWPAVLERFPEFDEQASRFASPPIRNSATLCGNLANGSPIGDCIPALIALGAELDLRRGPAARRLPLEDFYLGYRQNALEPGEFVAGVSIPARLPGVLIGSYKLSKRIDQDISAVSATFCVTVDGTCVQTACLAYGGLAGIACRAREAERALTGGGWNKTGIDAAVAALGSDFAPMSDLRAGSDYRRHTAGQLLRRFYLQHSAAPGVLRIDDALRVADIPR